jgi:hypothetical protein
MDFDPDVTVIGNNGKSNQAWLAMLASHAKILQSGESGRPRRLTYHWASLGLIVKLKPV